ncbi:MAG: hypothetical protein WC663_01610 [Patescibacteria group bacterium]|jgi:hypothetical protein
MPNQRSGIEICQVRNLWELTIFKFDQDDLKKIDKKIKLVKDDVSRKVFFITCVILVMCLGGIFIQPNEILKIISVIFGIIDLIVLIFHFCFEIENMLAKNYISKPKDAYAKYCLQLYQLIVIINKQITRYNLAVRNMIMIRSSEGESIYDENLYKLKKKLSKKIERISIIVESLPEIKRTIIDQESSALIAELSHLAISEVDQANPLLSCPISPEGLEEEIEREEEVLASFQEPNQNQ